MTNKQTNKSKPQVQSQNRFWYSPCSHQPFLVASEDRAYELVVVLSGLAQDRWDKAHLCFHGEESQEKGYSGDIVRRRYSRRAGVTAALQPNTVCLKDLYLPQWALL